jgi:predicted RNA-binding protein with PUA-like domain
MRFWLFKSEPDVYNYDQLQRDGESRWLQNKGIRNHQAKNNLLAAKVGDRVVIYHSQSKPPHAAGIAEISREAYPDPLQFNPDSKYFDPKSDENAPRWFVVDVKAVEALENTVPIGSMREAPAMKDCLLLRNSRVSIVPLSPEEFDGIIALSKAT